LEKSRLAIEVDAAPARRQVHPALAGCMWLRTEAASVIGSNGLEITPVAPSDLKYAISWI
jgi:hypothetical protein